MGKTKDFSSDFNSLLGGSKEEKAAPKEKVVIEDNAEATPKKTRQLSKTIAKKTKPIESTEKEPTNPAPIPPKRAKKGSGEDKSYSLDDATDVEHIGRATKGRRKFTMMMRPDIRDMLNRIAINKRQSISDVIENVLCEYFDIE